MLKISDSAFIKLTEYMKKNYGVNLMKKRVLIESRLCNKLAKMGYDNYDEYVDAILTDVTGTQASALVSILTTNYTYFLREKEHFDFLRQTILPYVEEVESRERDLRTWSAGCSSGEEAYTIAMTYADYFGPEKGQWNKQILATDISENALSLANQSQYTDEQLENVPAMWKSKYFRKSGSGKWQVSPTVQKEVIFRIFNLMDPHFPFRKKFHVIFCRNVMIYFDQRTKDTLVEKFYHALEPGGYLLIGHSESISRDVAPFQYILPAIYRKER